VVAVGLADALAGGFVDAPGGGVLGLLRCCGLGGGRGNLPGRRLW